MIFREADGFSFRDLPFYARRPFSIVIVVPPTGRHDDFSVDDFGPHEMRVGKADTRFVPHAVVFLRSNPILLFFR